jgi:hypothetical protein
MQFIMNIDAETRLTPRMHFKCSLPALHPK